MAEGGDQYRDEVALGTIALVVSLGLLKANEMFDFFDKVDLFVPQGDALLVHGRELVAVVCFAACYVGFLCISFFGIHSIVTKYKGALGRTNLGILSGLVLVLAIAQFFSFAAGYSHVMHKYGDRCQVASKVVWDFSN
jgi:hypothetical protein